MIRINIRIFNIKVFSSSNNEVVPEYLIHNEGFRDFKINLGRRLKFEEEEKINVSFFEPMLMDGLKNGSDYYEINMEAAIEEYNLYMKFPNGINIISFDVTYMDAKNSRSISSILSKSQVLKEEDINIIYIQLKKPPIGKTIILNYNFTIPEHILSAKVETEDKFRVGYLIHSRLKESTFEKWLQSKLMIILVDLVNKLESGTEYTVNEVLNEYWHYIPYGTRKVLGRKFVERVRDNTITNVIELDKKIKNCQVYRKK